MKPGRNDVCPCGSGHKYKRCCLERDEAHERQERTVRAQEGWSLAGSEHEAEGAALAEGLRMVVTKDRLALSAALERFASLVATEETFPDLRFDDRAFARVVGQLFSPDRRATE